MRAAGFIPAVLWSELSIYQLKGLILAQNERWRRGLGMQVEREGAAHHVHRGIRGLRTDRALASGSSNRGASVAEMSSPGKRRKGE
jgi:hypothetical protein